jgi:subtilisin family serine protease
VKPSRAFIIFVLAVAAALGALPALAQAPGGKISPEVLAAVEAAFARGEPQDVLVTYDAAAVRAIAKQLRLERFLPHNDDEVLRIKALGYARTKEGVASTLGERRPQVLKSYGSLPVEYVRLQRRESLSGLLADARVTGVALAQAHSHQLAQSLALINQPGVAQQGMRGAGTAVAVLDTGVDYTNSAFGSCSAPGPACKVIYAQDFAPEDGLKDADGHGTNVAAIVLGVAPESRIIALDVFRPDGFAYTQDIVAAINWSIERRSQYNIASINMSLGGGKYASPISSAGDAFKHAIDDARAAGIVVVVASGNDGFTDALSSPGAVDTAVSVGAVYDSTMGPINWSKCNDPATAADKVTCFSNSASFLSVLAPGARITAAGVTYSGTSQATPHVAGAAAVLRAAYPAESVNQTISRLVSGVPVIDARNQITKPRLNLLQALSLDLVPDAFQFIDQVDAPAGIQIASNTVAISGISGRAAISISSPGEYSVNGGAFVAEARTVANGDVIQARITSSSTPGAAVGTTLTVGGISDSFSVTTSPTAAVPAVQLSPGALTFGAVNIAAAAAQGVTLANIGSATLNAISVAVTGSQDFSINANGCGASLAAGQSCAISVGFSPTAPVARSAALSVSSNAAGSPHTVPLSGTGTSVVSLSQAVDNAILVFSSSGNASWFGQTSVAFAAGDAARSGPIGDLQSTTMETTVTGPGSIGFYWKVSSEPDYDFLRFSIDGVQIASISGEVDWSVKTYSLGAGPHTLSWRYAKDSSVASGADAAWVDGVSFTQGQPSLSLSASSEDFGGVAVGASASRALTLTNNGVAVLAIGSVAISGQDFSKGADTCSNASVPPSGTCSVSVQFRPTTTGARTGSIAVPSNAAGSPHIATLRGSGTAQSNLGAAVDNASLIFTTGAAVPWFSQSAVTRVAGNNTAQSGPAGDLQVSYMETTVTGPGRLSFYWKVSSEEFYDRLALMLDGVTQGWVSGNIDWEQRFYDIGSGTHTIRWAYIKTAEFPSGVDAGWVDQVSFTPLAAPLNLAEALDAPSLAWRTIGVPGSSAPWYGQSVTSISGGDSAESPSIADDDSTTLRTAVRGPGTLSFKWKVSSTPNFDYLCIYVDFSGNWADCISGETDWTARSFVIPPGIWPIDWVYSTGHAGASGFDGGWVDQVVYTPSDVPLNQAVDTDTLTMETNPTAPWYGQAGDWIVGGSAARTSPIADGQRTWLQTTVTGPGTLSFYWKVSSEQDFDVLRFYVDGAELASVPAISGEVNWTQRTVSIGPGTHVVSWAYWKDFYGGSSGLDAAWVDGVVFTQTPPDTQAPAVPGGLTAIAVSISQIDLAWDAASDNIGVTAYRLNRGGLLIQTLSGGTLSYDDAGLAPATAYSYTVQACDAAGNCSAESASASATTPAPPPDLQPPTVPGGVTATAVSDSRINVSWGVATDNVGVTQYRVYRDTDSYATPIATVSVATRSWQDTGLTALTAYSYRVSACDAAGNCSVQSSSAGAATLAPGVVSFIPSYVSGFNAGGNALSGAFDLAAAFGSLGNLVAGISANVDSVWAWNAATQKWQFHTPQLSAAQSAAYAASNGYEVLTSVAAGHGFWVNAYVPITLPAQTGPSFSYDTNAFDLLPSGRFNLLAIGDTLTVQQFNLGVGVAPANFNALWAWDISRSKWYFYSPVLEQPGAPLTNLEYCTAYGYLDFAGGTPPAPALNLQPGVGFWVEKN